jgi:UDP-D-galactose:(glucosyl)LPS alpha-1,3-D-galactosyltransferase
MSQTGVVFGVDDRYLEPLLVTLTSLVVNGGLHGDQARIAVLNTGLSTEASERLALMGRRLELDMTPVAVEIGSDRFPVTDWISPAAYLRLHLAEALVGVDRVLYLDCDLIAVGSIVELLTLEIHSVLAAAQDVTNPTLGEGDAIPDFEALGLPSTQEYFNSGVMVVDVAGWLELDLAARCAKVLLEQREHIKYWDQDALNIVMAGRDWHRLDPRFNALVVSVYAPTIISNGDDARLSLLATGAAIEADAKVLHFAGPFKPWNPAYPSITARDRYLRAAKMATQIENGTRTIQDLQDEVVAR